ncbi:hypothetical protein EYF80_002701 [Liparis tanakae]|uniref:Uncharacterized protein n=1 Tax=Liparis tanakae TaxID=230148 RepID=A0A4Z2J9P4_9TELE|nr:hypothetical protein EYF80_002701 [Liparis tanakae]
MAFSNSSNCPVFFNFFTRLLTAFSHHFSSCPFCSPFFQPRSLFTIGGEWLVAGRCRGLKQRRRLASQVNSGAAPPQPGLLLCPSSCSSIFGSGDLPPCSLPRFNQSTLKTSSLGFRAVEAIHFHVILSVSLVIVSQAAQAR